MAVVTGGASGIGLATARRFVAEGARVMLGDLNADALAAADGRAGRRGGRDARRRSASRTTSKPSSPRPSTASARCTSRSRTPASGRWRRSPTSTPPSGCVSSRSNLLGPLLTIKHAARRMQDAWFDRPHGEPQRGAARRRYERVLLHEGGGCDARAGRGHGARPRGHPGERDRTRAGAHRADRRDVAHAIGSSTNSPRTHRSEVASPPTTSPASSRSSRPTSPRGSPVSSTSSTAARTPSATPTCSGSTRPASS